VRIACWLFVVSAVLAALGMFMPAVQLEVGGAVLSRRTTESVYQIQAGEGFARKLLARYQASKRMHVGKRIASKVMPHVGKTLKGHLDDITSAMSTLDDVSDDDVKTAAKAIAITLWTFLGLAIVGIVLVFTDLVSGRYHKSRMVISMIISLLLAVAGVALTIVLAIAAAELDDDLGFDVVHLAVAAYVIPAAAVGSFVAMVAALVARSRMVRRANALPVPAR
jgi:hypothetical protein